MDGLYIVVIARTEDAVGTTEQEHGAWNNYIFFHVVLALSTSTVQFRLQHELHYYSTQLLKRESWFENVLT